MNFFQMVLNEGSKAASYCVAIIGGGGKTSLLHRLGNEFSREYDRVLLTSLTSSAYPRAYEVVLMDNMPSRDLSPHYKRYSPLYLMGSKFSHYKLSGISLDELQAVQKQSEVCLFECDGARNLSLKVHKEHDPPVPAFATHVIIVVGADVVNTSISQGMVHRPELFRSVWHISGDDILDKEFITRVLTTSRGYLTKIPYQTRRIYFVNKSDTHPYEAEQLARTIHKESGFPAFYGSTQANICMKI